jgi:hypothetical protein
VAARRAITGRSATTRLRYLDNLKVMLIAVIIAGHGIVGYARLGFWPYAEMREATLSPVTETALLAVAIPFGFFVIPLLFLIAGLARHRCVRRRGRRLVSWRN